VQLAANVWPEFLQYRHECVNTELRSPNTQHVRGGSIAPWVVGICADTGRRPTSDNFRKVELVVPGITAGDDDATHGVTGSVPESTFAQLEITRILVKKGRQNGARHIVLNGAVGKSGTVSLSISGGSLSVSRLTVCSLTDASQRTIPEEFNVVEGALCHYFEFF